MQHIVDLKLSLYKIDRFESLKVLKKQTNTCIYIYCSCLLACSDFELHFPIVLLILSEHLIVIAINQDASDLRPLAFIFYFCTINCIIFERLFIPAILLKGH